MPTYSEIRPSPYKPEQLFQMVMDIERYPQFLPWCRAARILEQTPEFMVGELVVSFKQLTERYTSKITPIRGGRIPEIHVELVRGPFKKLSNHWKFEPRDDGGSNIHFFIEFEFKTKLLDHLIGAFFGKAQEKMVHAFTDRADKLYGWDTC
jgi:coenzyme Q-binding protein COQ10